MSIHIKEPGIPNTTKLINSFARVYKFLFIIILLYRKTIYIGLFKQYFTFLKDFLKTTYWILWYYFLWDCYTRYGKEGREIC